MLQNKGWSDQLYINQDQIQQGKYIPGERRDYFCLSFLMIIILYHPCLSVALSSLNHALSAVILVQIMNDVTSIKISFEIPHTETWQCTKGLLLKTQKRTPTGLGFMRMQYGPPCEMCMSSPLLVHWTIEGSNSIWNTAFRALGREAVTNNSYLFSKKLHRSLWGLLINALWINQGKVRDFSETSVSLCYLESHEFGKVNVSL